ncbi:MAG TPA: Fe-S cluster assembly protein SufD [Bacteroidia bacterium]|jgi:Fe-S cluster assembly protein SufD|nr:Fe-S cluster assembly protein SufD [Bacteroidia bacterium]
MVTDKLTVTHQLSEELSKISGKAGFMPAKEIGIALQYLEENGIPNNKHEDYKYCNTEAVIRKEFKNINGREISIQEKDLKQNYYVEGAYNIYVLNGKLSLEYSEFPSSAIITAVENTPSEDLKKHLAAYAKSNESAFIALNTAYADRGIFIKIKSGLVVDKTIVVHHIVRTENTFFFNIRNLFVIEKNAQVKITETFYPSTGKNFCNTLTEIFTGEHAHVNHCQVQNQGHTFYGVDTLHVAQNRYSNYSHSVFTFSGALVRNNLRISLNEEFCECHLFGLMLGKNQQIIDNHTLVDHQKPNCQSNELYKGIADGKSVLTFNGQIFVERDAQKTNAYQSSKNILLNDDATVNAKPELEIYANDVKCSHGTSTGKVDENALFYLKARGIGEENARKLLLHAFAHEIIGNVADADTALFVETLFEHNLN